MITPRPLFSLHAKYDPPSDVEVVTRPKLFFKLPYYDYQSEKNETRHFISLE